MSDQQRKTESVRQMLQAIVGITRHMDELSSAFVQFAEAAHDISPEELAAIDDQPEVAVHESTGTCPECESHSVNAAKVATTHTEGWVYVCCRCDFKWVNNADLIEARQTPTQ